MNGAFAREFADEEPRSNQPIPIRPEVPEPGAYPIEALSPRLQGAARAIVDKVQLPAAIAGQSVLAAASLAVQAYADVELPTGERVPLSLFCITVAASGDRKSSCDKLALLPVRNRERELHDAYEHLQAEFVAENAAFQAATKKATTGTKNREEIRRAIEACGEAPIAPPQPLLVSDEGTLAGLQRLFAEAMPSLGLFSDEGGQWLGGHAMSDENRGQTGAALSKLWDGSPIKRVRAGDGFTILRGRRLALHLMIQPRMARTLFSDETLRDQGLLSRILICQPLTMKGQRMWRDAEEESSKDLAIYMGRANGLLSRPFPMDERTRELKPGLLTMTAEARQMWVAFHDVVEKELKAGGSFEAISGFAGKLPEHAARIGAVMSYFEDSRVTEISGTALAAGIKIAQFHAAESLRLFGVGGADADTERAAELMAWVRKNGLQTVGTRMLTRNGPGRKMTGPDLKRAIALLVDLKHLVPISEGASVTLPSGKEEFAREAYSVVAEA